MNRRKFIKNSGLATVSTLLPQFVFAENLPKEMNLLVPSKWTKAEDLPDYFTILNETPLNAYPAVEALAPKITPEKAMFIRNNGQVPEVENSDPDTWTLTIAGESVLQSKTYTIKDLKDKFPHKNYQLTLECGGNGRAGFYPPSKGNQWGETAVSCPTWQGVSLKDILMDCGIKEDAVYVGYHSADKHLKKDEEAISRGIPIAAALDEFTLIAWSMNNNPLPILHGFPLRLVAGGRPGSVSGKWLKGISVRNKIHDGNKMAPPAYQIPKYPVAPGEDAPLEDYRIIESMVVKSLITAPASGTIFPAEQRDLMVSGHAWAGLEAVKSVDLSIDFGRTWHTSTLSKAVNQYAWQHFEAVMNFPQAGYYEVWARATDEKGNIQPIVQGEWNPKGYLFNACHRIAVRMT